MNNPAAEPDSSNKLKKNVLGVPSIFFYVIAAASPFTVVVGLFPIIIGLGNGIGAAGAFVLAAVTLLVFAVGYVSMSRHITNAGAFYAYVTAGLGKELGLGSAFLTMFSYVAIQAALFGGFGFYLNSLLSSSLGIDPPWWLLALIGLALCTVLAVQGVHSGARWLGFFMTLEMVMILVLVVFSLFRGDTPVSAYSLEPFAPHAVFSGAFGIAIMFAICSFIGFEGSAIYSEEAKDPHRTIPRATFLSVGFMGVVYALTAWVLVNAVGVGTAKDTAIAEGGDFLFYLSGRFIGGGVATMFQVLICTAMFAAILTFHNNVARYLYSLGRQNLLWSRLGRTMTTRQTPYVASLVQSGGITVLIVVAAVLHLDPIVTIFAGIGGIGTIGVILSQAIASVAIFAFFRRTGADRRPWNAVVAPLLAAVALLSIVVAALYNLDVLLGVGGGTGLLWVSTLLVPLVFGAGYGWYLRSSQPQRYAELDRVLTADNA
ncbi:APC family permease [Mycolicibacterium sp.]|uniref:APC family permease n=1 Tax=Mycolicibacterium sp. TaxID=2320850 RepID=UPI003D14EBC3